MKEMTTAEFAKANLAALEEPVRIRRYTKSLGTYYPEGYIASLPGETVPRLDFEFTAAAVDVAVGQVRDRDTELVAARKVIAQLEEDNRYLKKELAARPPVALGPPVGSELLSQERRTIPAHPMKDAFAGLAKQDREFFERKLGKPGKTK